MNRFSAIAMLLLTLASLAFLPSCDKKKDEPPAACPSETKKRKETPRSIKFTIHDVERHKIDVLTGHGGTATDSCYFEFDGLAIHQYKKGDLVKIIRLPGVGKVVGKGYYHHTIDSSYTFENLYPETDEVTFDVVYNAKLHAENLRGKDTIKGNMKDEANIGIKYDLGKEKWVIFRDRKLSKFRNYFETIEQVKGCYFHLIVSFSFEGIPTIVPQKE